MWLPMIVVLVESVIPEIESWFRLRAKPKLC